MKIKFEKANLSHQETIFKWLNEPHVMKFWDNSEAHKQDIILFLNGRQKESTYFNGLFIYWIATLEGVPYAMLMTIREKSEYDLPAFQRKYLSTTGNTYCIDYMIGNTDYIGKGLGAITLSLFTDFIQICVDVKADTFWIDPVQENPKAIRVYEKAGFVKMEDFIPDESSVFSGKNHFFMIKNSPPKWAIKQATLSDYPIVQNMARFYVYDASKYCGLQSKDWAIQEDGLYTSFDFKPYFEEENRKAFIIRVDGELAGFVLLNKESFYPKVDWNIGEFFILRRYQKRGLGASVLQTLVTQYPGSWEAKVIPQNKPAITFWRNSIRNIDNEFNEEVITYDLDKDVPIRYLMSFKSRN